MGKNMSLKNAVLSALLVPFVALAVLATFNLTNVFQASADEDKGASPHHVNTEKVKAVKSAEDQKPSYKQKENTVSNAIQTAPVIVKVQSYIAPLSGSKCYAYTVENNADRPLVGIDIGVIQSTDESQLVTLPQGWSDPEDAPGLREAPNSISMVDAFRTEEQNNYFVSTKGFRVNPGNTTGELYICMQGDWDPSYTTAHWVAYKIDGSTYTGQLVNLGPM